MWHLQVRDHFSPDVDTHCSRIIVLRIYMGQSYCSVSRILQLHELKLPLRSAHFFHMCKTCQRVPGVTKTKKGFACVSLVTWSSSALQISMVSCTTSPTPTGTRPKWWWASPWSSTRSCRSMGLMRYDTHTHTHSRLTPLFLTVCFLSTPHAHLGLCMSCKKNPTILKRIKICYTSHALISK